MKRFFAYASMLLLAGLATTGCDFQSWTQGADRPDSLCYQANPSSCAPQPDSREPGLGD